MFLNMPVSDSITMMLYNHPFENEKNFLKHGFIKGGFLIRNMVEFLSKNLK